MNKFFNKCLIYVIGLFILALGVVSMIKSNVGIAPWDALNVALSKEIGFTIGSWVFIVGGIVIFANSLIKKSFPNISGFIPILIIGFFVDLLNLKLLSFIVVDSMFFQWCLFFCGICLLAFGIATYLRSSFPSVPNDELMLIITERTGWAINITKTIGETIAFLLAFFLKGPIGIGTLIVVLFLGLLVGFFDQLFQKVGFTRSLIARDR